MEQSNAALIDVVIDKLTNSIVQVENGVVFETDVEPFRKGDKGFRKRNWRFDWRSELNKPNREVMKLSVKGMPDEIHGLISLENNHDHVLIHLVESAKFNQGKAKIFAGVAGNLFAYACKWSFELGYDGFVAFRPKTQLVEHYIHTLGAVRFVGNQLVLNQTAALELVGRYFKNVDYGNHP